MAAGHYTWLKDIPQALSLPAEVHYSAEKLIWAGLVGVGLVLLAKRANRTKAAVSSQELLVPDSSPTLHGILQLFVDGFSAFHDSIVGKENRKYLPISASTFLFIFVSNLIGLFPGVAAITTTVWINVAIAIVVFIYFNYLGVREHGVVNYLKHFAGPIIWVAPLIFAIEIFGTVLRVLTLNLRLYWNITADHVVLATFTELAPYGVPVIFYAFGTFVCFMQAFIFTILTMIYILLATQHEEEHA